MTYRERLQELIGNNPAVFNLRLFAGVAGCPARYFEGGRTYCGGSSYECNSCWSKEYQGEKYIGRYPVIEEKRVTYKEKLRELIGDNSEVFDNDYGGGVLKCPRNYFLNALHRETCTPVETCKSCWNAEYQGERYIGKWTANIGEGNQPEPDQQAKFDHDKPRLSLVPMKIVWDIAQIREYGTKKYKDPENWRKVEVERYFDAFLRHALSVPRTELLKPDAESGLPHLWHCACNLAFILELMEGEGKC